MAKPAVNQTIYIPSSYTTSYYDGRVIVTAMPNARISTRVISLTAVTPQWAQRQQGIPVFVPPRLYTARYYKRELQYGFQTYPHPTFGYTRSGSLDPTGTDPPAATAAQMNLCLQAAERKALSKLKNQNVNFAQFFGEGKQVCDLFNKTGTRLAKAALKIKKGNVAAALRDLGVLGSNRQVRNTARNIHKKVRATRRQAEAAGETWSQTRQTSSLWLESSFGWSPLLQDVQGAAKLLADRATADPSRQRFCVRHNYKQKVPTSYTRLSPGTWEAFYKQQGQFGCFIRLDFRFDNAALASAAADGLTNPLSLAWELTPFSFCSDYMINLGGWLELLDASLGKEFIGGTATLYRDWSRDVETFYRGQTYGKARYTEREKYVNRNVYGSFPSATNLALQIKNPLNSAKRIANVVALLRQAFTT